MERRTLLDRIRDFFAGRRPKKNASREPGVWNQPAPANRAGDAPLITSHGRGPSHAH